ncbi:LemA family protein [Sporosarcina sp. FSL W7-1283]|uniref:LemA family protein n=1 Tax=Sporosarcina sp. FSL W7-1283 TaxID=2921560 RepID=UPI0030F73472
MNSKLFGVLVSGGIITGLLLLFFSIAITNQNKAINLEEQINESSSSINVQEKRRADLIVNLVDTVQAYDEHEKETLKLLTEARSKASSGLVEEAQLTIQAVTEAYPELKSIENYKTLMNELATTENLIAQHRNNYNVQVKAYSKHIRKFPNKQLLGLVGYESLDKSYIDFEVSPDAPTDLFNKGE